MTKLASSTSLTLTLPSVKLDLDKTIALFRSAAQSGVHATQPNIVSKEDLLEAQKHPENYRHIIVRICGFSAPFVDLSEEYQKEFLDIMVFEL